MAPPLSHVRCRVLLCMAKVLALSPRDRQVSAARAGVFFSLSLCTGCFLKMSLQIWLEIGAFATKRGRLPASAKDGGTSTSTSPNGRQGLIRTRQGGRDDGEDLRQHVRVPYQTGELETRGRDRGQGARALDPCTPRVRSTLSFARKRRCLRTTRTTRPCSARQRRSASSDSSSGRSPCSKI